MVYRWKVICKSYITASWVMYNQTCYFILCFMHSCTQGNSNNSPTQQSHLQDRRSLTTFLLIFGKIGVEVRGKSKSTGWRAACAGSKENVSHDQWPPRDPGRPWQSVGHGAPARFHNTEQKLQKLVLSVDSKLYFYLVQVFL